MARMISKQITSHIALLALEARDVAFVDYIPVNWYDMRSACIEEAFRLNTTPRWFVMIPGGLWQCRLSFCIGSLSDHIVVPQLTFACLCKYVYSRKEWSCCASTDTCLQLPSASTCIPENIEVEWKYLTAKDSS